MRASAYIVSDLGSNTCASSLNNNGQVLCADTIGSVDCGYFGGSGQHLYLSGNNGSLPLINITPLNTSIISGTDVNDNGDVVGSIEFNDGSGGGFKASPPSYTAEIFKPTCVTQFGFNAINSLGDAVAGSQTSLSFQIGSTVLGPGYYLFRGCLFGLGTAPGYLNTDPFDINSSGIIVGSVQSQYSEFAFVSDPTYTVGMGLNVIGHLGGTFSRAYAINDSGQVVGHSSVNIPGIYTHAFLWDPNSEIMQDIGVLSGDVNAIAADINNDGVIIGSSIGTGISYPRGFVYFNGEMFDLNSIIENSYGYLIRRGIGVNNRNQAVVNAVDISNVNHALLIGLVFYDSPKINGCLFNSATLNT